jgi:hypothetical protein
VKKLFWLILILSIVGATSSGFVHPTDYVRLGNAEDRTGTTPQNAIDNNIGDYSTWWRFVSDYYGGADFWIQTSNITMQSITLQSISSGNKDFVVKRKDGGYDIAYSVGSGINLYGSGTLNGDYIQSDGKIIVGVRNTANQFLHDLNDISFNYEYGQTNALPSVPNLLSPSFNESFDSSVFVSWSASLDLDGDSITYFVDYSSNNGSNWISLASNLSTLNYSWDAVNYSEGTYSVGVRAFDSKNYSARNYTQISLRHIFFSNPVQAKIVVGTPVTWSVGINGSGNWTCSYQQIPPDYLGVKVFDQTGVEQSIANDSNSVSWNCNLSQTTYKINYTTPAVVFTNYGWNNLTEFHLRSIQSVKNPTSLHNYSSVGGSYECYSNFTCNQTTFSYTMLSAEEEKNESIDAQRNETDSGSSSTPTPDAGATATPSPSPSATATSTLTPSVSASPTAEVDLGGDIDIRVPDEIEVGEQTIGVFIDGIPANGLLKIYDPQGNIFSRELQNGLVKFVFDREGRWRVAFGNKTKEIKVIKTGKPTPTKTVFQPSSITGLASLNLNPVLGALILLLILAALAWYKFFYRTVKVKRVLKDGKVEISIKNRLGDLKSVRVLELVPEESASDFSSNPKIKQTVTGDLLEWVFENVKKGETITITHSLNGNQLDKPLEVKIETGKGEKKSFFG